VTPQREARQRALWNASTAVGYAIDMAHPGAAVYARDVDDFEEQVEWALGLAVWWIAVARALAEEHAPGVAR
jgi:hypothetical protein